MTNQKNTKKDFAQVAKGTFDAFISKFEDTKGSKKTPTSSSKKSTKKK